MDITATDFIVQRQQEKKAANEFQLRRHVEWNDNYELSRGKPKINRLTQRQAVMIPLMKETMKTLISKIDDAPNVKAKDIDGDELKEIITQEMWDDDFDRLNFEGIDLQGKKTVLHYGRTFKKLDWTSEGFKVYVPDIFDVIIDPMVDPLDIETARFIIHQNIYRSLREILANPRYTTEGKNQLKQYLTTKNGMIQSDKDKEAAERKNERMKAMGVRDTDFPLFAGGDTVVNLTEHMCQVWSVSKQDWERRVVVYADDMVEMYNETLMDCLGVDFWPYTSWADDVETNDWWSDAAADLVRTPNKILNVWYSQMIENRTLGNFNMQYYDVTASDSFKPQQYEPGPGLWIPSPGDPNKVIMPVPIQKLDDNMKAIDYITQIVERATAATAIDKGVSEQTQQTLGEIKILVGKAMERTLSMQKFYRRDWKEFAVKRYGLYAANEKKRTIYKTGSDGKMWPKIVYPGDWKSSRGYKWEVSSTSEQEEDQTKGIQRMMFVMSMFPNNLALKKITQRRSLEQLDLTPAELKEVEDGEKQVSQQVVAGQSGAAGAIPPPAQPGLPPDVNAMNSIQSKLGQLGQPYGA